MRSTDRFLRFNWISAIVVSISITAWQLDEAVAKYLEYPSTTTMHNVMHKSVFPWVTVCNVSPIPDGILPFGSWIEFKTIVDLSIRIGKLLPDTGIDLRIPWNN